MKKILVVDDEADIVQLISMILSSFWCEMGVGGRAASSRRCALSELVSSLYRVGTARAMVSKLAVNTPHPIHLPKPNSPLSRHLPR